MIQILNEKYLNEISKKIGFSKTHKHEQTKIPIAAYIRKGVYVWPSASSAKKHPASRAHARKCCVDR